MHYTSRREERHLRPRTTPAPAPSKQEPDQRDDRRQRQRDLFDYVGDACVVLLLTASQRIISAHQACTMRGPQRECITEANRRAPVMNAA